MVNEYGQLYTIEGVAAAFLMIFTTYIVLSTTAILTPADTHVIDMQLEQLGNDALAMMDTPDPAASTSDLEEYVRNWKNVTFRDDLDSYLNNVTDVADTRPLNFAAYINYRDSGGEIKSKEFYSSPQMTGTDRFVAAHPVTVTRWVYVPYDAGDDIWDHLEYERLTNQVMLLEVTLWRD